MDPTERSTRDWDEDVRRLRFRLAAAASLLVAVTAVGTVGYRLLAPGTPWIDALYMTVITLTTVGFGEIVDLSDNPGGRLFTAALILVGMGGVLYFVSTATAFVLEGQLGHVFWRRRMDRRVSRMEDHLVVCGSGSTARYAARELLATARSVVVVCEDDERARGVQAELPDVPVIVGDAAQDDVLLRAGVERAAGVVACTENDRENLVVTLSARQLNPGLRIVARVGDIDAAAKVRKVGADAVVSPDYIGGLRLASELVRPTVVSFLDEMLRDGDGSLRIDELRIPGTSRSAGRPVGELAVGQEGGALLMAVRTAAGRWVYNPAADMTVEPGAALILMASPEEMARICRRLEGEMVSRPADRSG